MIEPDYVGLFEDLSKADNSPDLSEGRMLRFLLRKVISHVSPSAFRVLMFIFDRTYTYGKTSEAITTKQFLEGITYNGVLMHPPVQMSRANLYRAIAELVGNVTILRKTDRRTNRTMYMINPIWTEDFVVPNRTVNKTKPKHTELVSPMRQGSLTHETSLSHPCNGIEQEDSNMRIKTGAAVPHSMTVLLGNVIASSGEARTKQKLKGNSTSYQKIWEDAYRTAYPDEQIFAWRVAEQASFKRALKRGNITGSVIPSFIDFVVSEFPSVIREHLSWMRNPPEYPTPGFVVKHIEVFFTAFRDKDDPNRKVRGAISRVDKPATPTGPSADELKKLELELASERAKREAAERERDQVKGEASGRRFKLAKRTIAKRPERTEEFGSWED